MKYLNFLTRFISMLLYALFIFGAMVNVVELWNTTLHVIQLLMFTGGYIFLLEPAHTFFMEIYRTKILKSWL